MKEEAKEERATGREGENPSLGHVSSRRFAAALLFIAVCSFPFAFTSSAHEPITTKVRFNKEVVRILQRSCLGCHHSGGIAMSLAAYDEARPWAKAIKEEVLEKRMPPWHAVKGYGEFRNAPSLAQRDIDIIVNWVEGGAPKGDDKDLPAGPLFSNDWQLRKPDLILKPDAEAKIAADADEYRKFVLPANLNQDRWLTAIDLLPGNGALVHCAEFYFLRGDTPVQASTMMAVKNEEGALSDPMNLPARLPFATWMPGQKTVELPQGVAQLLPARTRIGVTIHYRGSGEAATDLTAVGLYFAENPVTRQLLSMPVIGPDTVIPVGVEPRQLKMSITADMDFELIGIRPRVHPMLVSLQATAYRPDGSQEVLIWTRGYQFDWEPAYLFKRPVSLPKGTRIEVVTYFDNSEGNQHNRNDPPKPVRWSELTTDPWCVLLLAGSASQ